MDMIRNRITSHIKFLFAALCCLSYSSAAVSQTFIPHPDVRNQWMIGETGGGAFTPREYYEWFHKSYMSGAMRSSKLNYRTLLMGEFMLQKPMAEALDSALTDRSRAELLNFNDREAVVDWAYGTEKDKLEDILNTYQLNISKIQLRGGTRSEKDAWEERYNATCKGLEAIRDAYMPMGERHEQYLEIYNDIVRQNNELTEFLRYVGSRRDIERWQKRNGRSGIDKSRVSRIASIAFGRWHMSMSSAWHNR